ncbi:MAG: L-seryl-tRNA(Sec) selenium transferase [Pseudomonadota bacterium]
MNDRIKASLKNLPAVDEILRGLDGTCLGQAPHWALVQAIREQIDNMRKNILANSETTEPNKTNMDRLKTRVEQLLSPGLCSVLNATGVVLHTNLGRAPLGKMVIERVDQIATGYSNLEYSLKERGRGSRHEHAQELLCRLCNAQAAAVVNNNAAAVLLGIAALAKGREVVVSRGELVEIGGSFRLPDVMSVSGATLREVGTTNRTRISDYEQAINENTALLLKVHHSNFAMVGFTSEASAAAIVELGRARSIPTMFDLGSGTLMDLDEFGLPKEPTVPEVVKLGFDLVTFSGDKLLGGPQAGIIVGEKSSVEKVRTHPLMRVVRPGKLTLAALVATLEAYRDGQALEAIPSLNMLKISEESLKARSEKLVFLLSQKIAHPWNFQVVALLSKPGGGSLPQATLPSWGIAITHPEYSADQIETWLRQGNPPIIARIDQDKLVLDLRTIPKDQDETLGESVIPSCFDSAAPRPVLWPLTSGRC